MKEKLKHIVAAVLVSIGFLGLAIWGWNPYTGFLFVLTMFCAGTSGPPVQKESKTRFEQILSSLQGLSILCALCLAAWIAGQEIFHRIISNPGFLLLCWSWVQLVIAERFYRQQKSGMSQQTDSLEMQ